MPAGKRLTRDDWAVAGLGALVSGGPQAVAIEPVAAALGATKGSGYWHFSSRADFLEAVLRLWRQRMTLDVIDAVQATGGSPYDRMRRLLSIVTGDPDGSPAEMLLVTSPDPVVRGAVAEATSLRLAYIERLIREHGIERSEAHSRAVLSYAAYLGHATLASAMPDLVPRSRIGLRRMQEEMLSLALPARPV